VIGGLALLVISLGALVAGRGYVKMSARMRSFATTRGTVIKRELGLIAAASPEPRFGKGGPNYPKATYTYVVEGVTYTSSDVSYAHRGMRRHLAEAALAAIPDEVDVYYDPAEPGTAYLERHTPQLGRYLVVGGWIGVVLALIIVLGSV